jgi:predicted Rossmann-fold nucleotide-binding protein
VTESEKLVMGVESEALQQAASAHESWRILGIMSEFVEATRASGADQAGRHHLRQRAHGARVAVLSIWPRRTARLLSDSGFSVITGGGPGHHGSGQQGRLFTASRRSVGLNIQLPHEQQFESLSRIFRRPSATSSRASTCSSASPSAYVVMPGGFGTLDELMEALTLIQTGKARKIPMILMCAGHSGGA